MQNHNPKLKNKNVVILVEQQYQDLELWYPYFRIKEAGADVYIVGPEKKEYKGKYGYPAKADFSIKGVKPDEFDAVIIPGGFAPDYMRRVPAMIDFVRKMHERKKIIAAICHGGWILASARIIKGKRVTSFSAIRDDMINAGARFCDEEVVRDKNIITSRKPEDLPAFCRMIIARLGKKSLFQKILLK